MGFNVSIVMEELGYLEPDRAGFEVHGANLSITGQLRAFGGNEDVDQLEIFVPPKAIADRSQLEKWAGLILPPHRRGRGVLHFLPSTSLPEIWGDGRERICWTRDPWWMSRERSLRDRFAAGPTPIMVDTHSLGQHEQNERLAMLAGLPRVDFDVLCALTQPVADAYEKVFSRWLTPGVEPPFSIEVLPHAVDIQQFRPVSRDERVLARRTLGLREEGRLALYFGRLTPNSKADLLPLLQAFKAAGQAEDRLAIGGIENVPGYVSRLKQEADDLGIGSRVDFFPAVTPSMRHLAYAAADFFVFPGDTVQEAMANTLLEAMATGIPVLLSDWDGMKSVSVDGETGIHVPTQWVPGLDRTGSLMGMLPQMTAYLYMSQSVWLDVDALTAGLRALFSDSDLRGRMGRAGRERVEALYSPEAVWARTATIWSAALDKARRESADDLSRRRAAAPMRDAMPLLDIFGHYATGVVDPDRDFLRITADGEACLAGRREIRFYDECLAVVHPRALSALRKLSWHQPQLMRSVVDCIQRETALSSSDSLFHLALLLKRGIFSLTKGE